MSVLGLDIGYGNLKIAFGSADAAGPLTEVYPATAVPAEKVTTSLFGDQQDEEKGFSVQIDGRHWKACVPVASIQGKFTPQLHDRYVGSPEWLALAYAGLLLCGESVIDTVVSGLPVKHFADADKCRQMREALKGVHRITEKRTVEVRSVQVVPQPIGAYMEAMHDDRYPEEVQDRLAEETSLIIDPGFFSLDWTLIRPGGEYVQEASGSSLFAVSKLVEVARRLIAEDFGTPPSFNQLENALREDRESLYVYRTSIPLKSYFSKAAEVAAKEGFNEMMGMMRQFDDPINFVVMAGGGSQLYRSLAQSLYPESQILIAERPEMSNARGFWHFGAQRYLG